jgi:hypothetical protein
MTNLIIKIWRHGPRAITSTHVNALCHTGYLRRVSDLLVHLLPLHTVKNANFDLLKTITAPLTQLIVMVCEGRGQVEGQGPLSNFLPMVTPRLPVYCIMPSCAQLDKRALEKLALGQTDDPDLRLLKVS